MDRQDYIQYHSMFSSGNSGKADCYVRPMGIDIPQLGLIGFDSHCRAILTVRIKENEDKDYYNKYFAPIESRELTMPAMYKPDTKFLEWHMDEIFQR